MSGFRLLTLVVGLAAASAARADRREIYTLIGYEAGAGRHDVPAQGSGDLTAYVGAVDVTGYYGLTNTIHVGGRLGFTMARDLRFAGATLIIPPGDVQSMGEVYANHRGIRMGALGLYRHDTHSDVAPLAELELGWTMHRYTDIEHVSTGSSYPVTLPDSSQTVLHASATVAVEYRFSNHWVASAGLGARFEVGGGNPWGIFVPIRIGRIW